MTSLQGIGIFVKVCETMSFAQAGRRLGLSASAVGKSIKKTEERLGVRLFHRNTRAIHLTSEGALYLKYCRDAVATLDQAERHLHDVDDTPRGRLQVSLPLVCGPFQSTLMRFVQDHPELELELDFSDRLVDIIEEGFDVVVRTGRLSDSRLRSRRLGVCNMMLVATPGYLEANGTPEAVEELEKHLCLRFRSSMSGKLQPWPVPGSFHGELHTRLTSSHVEVLYHAALQNVGIAYLPDFLVRDALEVGKLRTVLESEVHSSTEFHLVWPASDWTPPKLRVFIDFMANNFLPSSARETV